MSRVRGAFLLALILAPTVASALYKRPYRKHRRVVTASWYRAAGRHHTTANGETMHNSSFTAAHRTMPFGTKLKVTNVHNGKSAVVLVNDRGPFAKGRSLDVSPAAARKLQFTRQGTAPVIVHRVK